MIRDIIREIIGKTIEAMGGSLPFAGFSIQSSPKKEFGDYSATVVITDGKEGDKKKAAQKYQSKEVLSLIAENTKKNPDFNKYFKDVKAVEPVFINFFLKPEFLQKQVKGILDKKEEFGEINVGKNRKVQAEFISANPTGPLTVANARGGPMGDVLSNVLKAAGYKAEKEFYVNDSGMQILALGHSVLKDKEAVYKGKYIDGLHKKIKEKDPYKAGQKAAKIIVSEMIKKTTDKLGIKYDNWFFESSLRNSGKTDKILGFLKDKKLTYEKDGATWFRSSKFGDDRDRVLVKSDGQKTYLAGDIAYHYNKFKERKFDKVINIWGADHHGDVPGLQAGVEAIGYKGKLDIIIHQFITILEKGKKVRMSKRQGVFVTVDELLEEVGVDVLRFFFLMYSANHHMDFDLTLAREKSEKNPVYYVQYAHARICSILRKCKNREPRTVNHELLTDPSELDLIKELIKLPEIVEDTAKDYQVQRLPHYAMNLAAVFHKFYTDCRVLGEDKDLEEARLALILATKIALKNTLDLMGIKAPEKM